MSENISLQRSLNSRAFEQFRSLNPRGIRLTLRQGQRESQSKGVPRIRIGDIFFKVSERNFAENRSQIKSYVVMDDTPVASASLFERSDSKIKCLNSMEQKYRETTN